MDEFTRRRWERIADQCCDRAFQAALEAVNVRVAVRYLPAKPSAFGCASAIATQERSEPLPSRRLER